MNSQVTCHSKIFHMVIGAEQKYLQATSKQQSVDSMKQMYGSVSIQGKMSLHAQIKNVLS